VTTGVLLFGNHPPPFGGVPSHVQDLAGHLAGRGWAVHVLSMAGPRRPLERTGGYSIHRPGPHERLAALARLLRARPGFAFQQATRFPTLAAASPKLFLGCLSLAAFCWETAVREQLQLISAYHLFSAGLAGAWAAELLEIPLVTTVFGDIYASPASHQVRIREVRYIVARSRALLSCSHHCARSFELLGIARPVRAVHYGVDTEVFSPAVDPCPVRERHGLAPEDCVVLYVGRMVREMGLRVLLDALPRILSNSRIKVLIAGGSGDLRSEAVARAGRNPGRVFVIPDVPQQELARYYSAATIAVSPSVNERACLGLAVAEAMATARPVVVTNVGGGPELVEHEVNGLLIPPGSSVALAEAVLSLADDPERCRRLGERGLLVARRDFDRRTTNARMEEVFREALG
jgi:glycosyltransferase involved in cell wall biosynthesis